MSRRQEIKQKEILQLKFQTAIKNNNDMIKKWLKPSTIIINDPEKDGNDKNNDKKVVERSNFLNLPVIEPGKSLTTINKEETISKFFGNDGNKEKEKPSPINSLMNKLKTSRRNERKENQKNQNQNQNQNKNQFKPKYDKKIKKPTKTSSKVQSIKDDDDSEEEENFKTSVKKPKLLF